MLQVNESSSPKPPKITSGSFRIFSGVEIFASEGAPPVSTTPVANLPPAANFATGIAGVVDTGGK